MITYVGFGVPETQDFARFTVMADSASGVYPDWSPVTHVVTDYIVGSSNFEKQILGFGEARITLRLKFDSRDQFRAFQARWFSKQTLVLLAQFARHEGEVRHWLGRDYEFYPDTLLEDIGSVLHQVGGTVECTATFTRSASGLGVGQW